MKDNKNDPKTCSNDHNRLERYASAKLGNKITIHTTDYRLPKNNIKIEQKLIHYDEVALSCSQTPSYDSSQA